MSRTTPGLLILVTAAAIADATDDVRCREIGFSFAAENRDAGAFRAYIDEDARFIADTAIRGPAAITDAWQVFFDENGPAIKWRPRFVEVLDDGKLAMTRGPYRLITTAEDGTRTEHWGTFNSVWRLQPDGSWKVVFDAGSNPIEMPTDDIKHLLEQEHSCSDDPRQVSKRRTITGSRMAGVDQ